MINLLSDNWKIRKNGTNETIDAKIPGSVYSNYLLNDRMPDPFWRDNEDRVTELSRSDYDFFTEFDLDEQILMKENIYLVCEGLDTICDIFLNDKKIAHCNNMHRTYRIDLKDTLRKTGNELLIRFYSPIKYMEQKQKQVELLNTTKAISGISHLRKAHYMSGWDWAPQLPDMGIWRDIYISAYDTTRIENVFISQKHENETVELDLDLTLEDHDTDSFSYIFSITDPNGNTESVTGDISSAKKSFSYTVKEPKLWWANNMGPQHLYSINIKILNGNEVLDEINKRIGLRTLVVHEERDEFGETFEFRLNGVPVFAMGADYVPSDSIIARDTEDVTEKLIKNCVKANFNCLRVWGGQYYPHDHFYDLCDEYGLIIWQDMMFACGIYHLSDEFLETVEAELKDNIRRIRHHACLGLWCGNNEQEMGWVEWNWDKKYPQKYMDEYILLFEKLIPEIVSKEDPNTFYWPSSPSSGGGFKDPNSSAKGDMHYWGVWHRKEPFEMYKTQIPRMMSEFGIQSYPRMKTINSFSLPEDRHIDSKVMLCHQKNSKGNEIIGEYVRDELGEPATFEKLVYGSQIVQAIGVATGAEHWRKNRGQCMGVIYWQLNDCWPVASWSSIDYYGRWKALHYFARRFFSPVMISTDRSEKGIEISLVNETSETSKGRLLCEVYSNLDDTLIRGFESDLDVMPYSASTGMYMDIASLISDNDLEEKDIYVYYCYDAEGQNIEGSQIYVKHKEFEFLDPEITCSVDEYDDIFEISVMSKKYARFVNVEFADFDPVLSDDFFDLVPGRLKKIEILKSDIDDSIALDALRNGLSIYSLYDYYK